MICGAPFSDTRPPTFDHIRPKSKGGRGGLYNLRLAHGLCNSRRGNIYMEIWRYPY